MCSSVHTGNGLTQIENAGYNSEIWLHGVHLLVSKASMTTGIIVFTFGYHIMFQYDTCMINERPLGYRGMNAFKSQSPRPLGHVEYKHNHPTK